MEAEKWERLEEHRLGVDHYLSVATDELLTGSPVRAYKHLEQAGAHWGELHTLIIQLQEERRKQ